ncbi:MAG: hypothetical protein V3T05_07695, partial [Myxococcota bacterium]
QRVLDTAVIDGKVGGRGSITWRVESCRIDVRDRIVSTDCNGTVTKANGAFTVTAERRIEGRVTGDPTNPIIPDSADAVRFTLSEVLFDDFEVTNSGSEASLTIASGSLSASMSPRLAVSATQGMCSVVTPNARFQSVRYADAVVHVKTADREFDAEVQASDFAAQSGVHGERENALSGTLTVWDKEKTVPGDGDGLDPEYDRKSFRATYACTDDLAQPESFACDLTPFLRHAVARLTLRNYGVLAGAIEADTHCGFSSPAIVASPEMIGTVGRPGGLAVYTVNDCVIEFPEPTVIATDCDGVEILASGRAVVTATKTLSGFLTGDPTQPIVPTNQDPATLEVTAELTNWVATNSKTVSSLVVSTGRLSGTIQPRMALDITLGVCSIATPNARFSNIALDNAATQLHSGGVAFDVSVTTTNLMAIYGRYDDFENHLEGSITVDGVDGDLPSNDPALDPNYDREQFDRSYQCDENMLIPESDADCDFSATLAQNGARLLVKALGRVAAIASADTSCGFAAIDHTLPTNITSNTDGTLNAVWSINNCYIGTGRMPRFVGEDCNGTKQYYSGSARVTGVKRVTGEFATAYPPLQPLHRQAVRLDFTEIRLTDFAAFDYAAGSTTSGAYMIINDAVLRGSIIPVTGEAADNPGHYYIATPVARFEGLQVLSATVTLVSGDSQFTFTLSDVDIDAFNGRYQASSNEIAGSVAVDGESYSVPVCAEDGRLDPTFEQQAFDTAYACTPNLLEPVPPVE